MTPVLRAENLRVRFSGSFGSFGSFGYGCPGREVLRGVSFHLNRGEMLALVGESGSGKSVLCRSLLGLPPKGAEVSAGALETPERISLVMQDAMTALDPAMPVGRQISETNRAADPVKLLRRVGIDDAEARARQYPGEFSGGMRQRAAIAVALAMRPEVILADEPTTSLDAGARVRIMELLNEIRGDGTAILFVTHDLSLARDFADRVLIMKDGEIIERGAASEIFGNPRREYTRELVSCALMGDPADHSHGKVHYHDMTMHSHEHTGPHTHDKDRLSDIDAPARAPLAEVRALSKFFPRPRPLGHGRARKILFEDINLSIRPGEITGLCGPSGAGKSTLARCIAGLESPSGGERRVREGISIHIIFQDSVSALNPRMNAEQIIAEPLLLRDGKQPPREVILELMRGAGLGGDSSDAPSAAPGEGPFAAAPRPSCEELLTRRPGELSGGQRQRVAIARAVAARPDLIIADEPFSSLDAVTCGKIIHLLKRLRDERNLTMLLISHDLRLLAHVSDRIYRMPAAASAKT